MANEMPSVAAVEAALADFPDPETGRSVVQLKQVRDIKVAGTTLHVTLALTSHSAPLWKETERALEQLLRAKFPAVQKVDVELALHHRPPSKLGQIGLTAKSVIAVGSGKGGVGKSTVAASIAFGLKRAGCEVGLLDADVYGPSIPQLLGKHERASVDDNQRIRPIDADGLKVMSIGFLVPPDQPVVARGPRLHGFIQSMLGQTGWGDLDFLIIDMPPGTGDIALSLSQLLPLSGAVVVCTPQDVALIDAVKAIAMFRTVHIPVLGIVENMSYFECPDNGKRYDIFGSGGAKKKSLELDVPFLGEVPIQIPIRVRGDQGQTAANFDDEASAPYFEAICQRLVKNLAEQHRAEPQLPSLTVLG